MSIPTMAGCQMIIRKISAIAEEGKFEDDHKRSDKCE
jgi:hypothetical protein